MTRRFYRGAEIISDGLGENREAFAALIETMERTMSDEKSLSDEVKAVGGGHPSVEERMKHEPLPVAGYVPQSQANIDLVNEGKALEERLIRYLERVEQHISGTATDPDFQLEMLGLGYRQIQGGCMWAYRSIMNPQRTSLPEDAPQAK